MSHFGFSTSKHNSPDTFKGSLEERYDFYFPRVQNLQTEVGKDNWTETQEHTRWDVPSSGGTTAYDGSWGDWQEITETVVVEGERFWSKISAEFVCPANKGGQAYRWTYSGEYEDLWRNENDAYALHKQRFYREGLRQHPLFKMLTYQEQEQACTLFENLNP